MDDGIKFALFVKVLLISAAIAINTYNTLAHS
jgi:hypothetical protein